MSQRQDIRRPRLKLQRLNITDFILYQRPDTKWKPLLVTIVRFTLYHLNCPLGTMTFQLPDNVKNSKSIIAMDSNSKGKFYKYHLYDFRCLATHQGHQCDRLGTHAKTLFNKWAITDKINVKTSKLTLTRNPSKGLNSHN